MGISAAADTPAMQTCFACLQPFGLGNELYMTCSACRTFMKAGIICIGVTDDIPEGTHALTYTDAKHYRSGNWCVVIPERLRDTPRVIYSNSVEQQLVGASQLRRDCPLQGMVRAGYVGWLQPDALCDRGDRRRQGAA